MSTLNSRLQLSILNQKKSKSLAEKGFTLIELLITVVILGVLSAVAVPGFLAQKDKADIAAANAQGKALMTACKTAIFDSSVVPENVRTVRKFGKLTWTPTVTPEDAAPTTTCDSLTTGGDATWTEQDYGLNTTTGDMDEFQDAEVKVSAG